jgi:hypothetical protein
MATPGSNSLEGLTSFPLPPCFAAGPEDDHDHGNCGACGFNLLLRQSGVMNTLVLSKK